jgi:hypothetical protein
MQDIAWKVGVLSFLEPRNSTQARWSTVPYSNYSYRFTIPGFLRLHAEAALTSLLGTTNCHSSVLWNNSDTAIKKATGR